MKNTPARLAALVLALIGAAMADEACTGSSSKLEAAECASWLDLYDGTGGADSLRNGTDGQR
jgi:hypothetical protein